MTTLSKIIQYDEMLNISSEFSRLREKCYLENAGAALYPQSLIKSVNEDLLTNIYMNPHTDKYTRDCIDQIRCLVLRHFHTDSSEYSVIFTSGATQALKLVVESFQFSFEDANEENCGSFVYLKDNHTSVLGLRELAVEKNANVIHISHEDFLKALAQYDISKKSLKTNHKVNALVAFPAQNNFNGFKYPLEHVKSITNGCLNSHLKIQLCESNSNWYTLLDAASFVPTNKLDLSKTKPDFVSVSFYKIFGYPTGLGALLVKNSSRVVMNDKKYFGGGTVDIVLSSEDFHVKRKDLYESFEDGTISFLSVISLKQCFDTLQKLVPKIVNNDVMDTISHHTFYLAQDLYQRLSDLRHKNDNKVAILYMDSDFTDIKQQGSIVTFNLIREDGTHIGYAEFQHIADLFNIYVRTGCFCNSGSCQRHLNISNKEMKDMYKAGHKCGDEIDLINGKPTGAIRVSFGYYNTFDDVDRLMTMICHCFLRAKYTKPKRVMQSHNKLELEPKINKLLLNEKMLNLLSKTFFRNIDIIPQVDTTPKIALKEIAIFPIKSCGAFKIKTEWNIGPKGFEYDREWMIVKDNGVCLTQKQNTRMCMIVPDIDLQKRQMVLHFKDFSPIAVSLDATIDDKQKEASFCQSKVCTDVIQGYDCGDEVADWISNALEISYLRLIRQSSLDNRVQKKGDYQDQKLLSLSNQAQFLLVNKATVKWLKGKIADPLFIDDVDSLTDRFRGNLIIDMNEELAEREWCKLIIGKHEFRVEGQCHRCQMVCIDQKTGEKTVEPLRTISEQFAGKLRFGIYLSYVGTINGDNDHSLKIHSEINPLYEDDIIQ